jgi:hypothetical protein
LIPGEPGNRNLADFSSVAVNPANGCVAIALPGDPENNNPNDKEQTNNFGSHAYVALQTGGPPLTANGGTCPGKSQSGGGGGGGGGGATPTGPGNSVCGDRVCDTGTSHSAFHGRVAKVTVSVGRIVSRKSCRFLGANGRLGKSRSCKRPVNLRVKKLHFIGGASNKTSWKFARRVRLAAGRYEIKVRGTDSFGHRENHRRVHNTITLRIR